jgi:hypothetical protein
MRTTPGKINQTCLELFGETAETAVPRLMGELEVPRRVAARLDVNPNAVRAWLLYRGWVFDPGLDKWVAPQTESELHV